MWVRVPSSALKVKRRAHNPKASGSNPLGCLYKKCFLLKESTCSLIGKSVGLLSQRLWVQVPWLPLRSRSRMAEATVLEGETIHSTWFPVTADMVEAAIWAADALGIRYRKELLK